MFIVWFVCYWLGFSWRVYGVAVVHRKQMQYPCTRSRRAKPVVRLKQKHVFELAMTAVKHVKCVSTIKWYNVIKITFTSSVFRVYAQRSSCNPFVIHYNAANHRVIALQTSMFVWGRAAEQLKRACKSNRFAAEELKLWLTKY